MRAALIVANGGPTFMAQAGEALAALRFKPQGGRRRVWLVWAASPYRLLAHERRAHGVPGGEPQNAAQARGVSRRLYQTLDIPKLLPLALT